MIQNLHNGRGKAQIHLQKKQNFSKKILHYY